MITTRSSTMNTVSTKTQNGDPKWRLIATNTNIYIKEDKCACNERQKGIHLIIILQTLQVEANNHKLTRRRHDKSSAKQQQAHIVTQ